MTAEQARIFANLQQDLLQLQGFKPGTTKSLNTGLDSMQHAFPNGTFPLGAVHEFISQGSEGGVATLGFVSALLSSLMESSGVSLWISATRRIFPPALKTFGIEPDKVIFVDLKTDRDVIWAIEESLKCAAITAVVGEVAEIDFTASRRLQLAVEKSRVTGFIHRPDPRKIGSNSFVSRWRVTPLKSHVVQNLPGIGYPAWNVELLKIRNGRPGQWEIIWENRGLHSNGDFETSVSKPAIKTAGVG